MKKQDRIPLSISQNKMTTFNQKPQPSSVSTGSNYPWYPKDLPDSTHWFALCFDVDPEQGAVYGLPIKELGYEQHCFIDIKMSVQQAKALSEKLNEFFRDAENSLANEGLEL